MIYSVQLRAVTVDHPDIGLRAPRYPVGCRHDRLHLDHVLVIGLLADLPHPAGAAFHLKPNDEGWRRYG
ncbi:hypothetical protein FMEAI12_4370013 [Parafrankia sp. Ea1.12]|nr:hypothetical protein FMEAI12_4370013 [Parafrankia sp. Ea1.12]